MVGKPVDRIDGPLKTTGTAPYAYERHDVAPNQAYGYVVGSAIAKGRIASIDLTRAKAAPGVLAIVTARTPASSTRAASTPPSCSAARRSSTITRRSRWSSPRPSSRRAPPRSWSASTMSARRARSTSPRAEGRPQKGGMTGGGGRHRVGDFAGRSPRRRSSSTRPTPRPIRAHAMMEPHASIAAWKGDKLTLWTSNQMIDWSTGDLAKTLGIPKENVRLISPFIGGGFGGKLFVRADALLAALGARAARRPVKVALPRALMFNNTTHRPATIQRIRIGATRDGKITAIGHESWSGDLPGGKPETAVDQTRLLYAGANRLTATRLAVLDLPEGNAMRAPGEAPGHDGAGDRHGRDGREARARSRSSSASSTTPRSIPKSPSAFSQRQLVECLRTGAERFGWKQAQCTARQGPRRALAGRHGRRRRVPQQPADEVGGARAARKTAS